MDIPAFLYLYVLFPLAAYSLGAVPFGLILCLLFKGVDIREHGSKNIGATNAGRVCGWPFFAAAFALDFAKGLVPVLAAGYAARTFAPAIGLQWLAILYGALAILGHTFPAYLGFRGGKGVATGFGVFIGLAPIAAAIAFGVWLVLFLAFRYVSLASLIAAVAAPVAYAWQHGADFRAQLPVFGFLCVMTVLVFIRHHANIRRLLTGTENRLSFTTKDSKKEDSNAEPQRGAE